MARKQSKYEFKPDRKKFHFLKQLYMTRLQRLQILKWSLYAALCIGLLVIQDVIMSQFHISGATTDLVVAAVYLIGLYEGMENDCLFALLASLFYLYSGSSPGPYCIGLLTAVTMGLDLFRQRYWNKSYGSIMLCTFTAIFLYEILIFLIGIFIELTIWPRVGVYVLTAAFTCAAALPLYPVVRSISKIGGNTWKD